MGLGRIEKNSTIQSRLVRGCLPFLAISLLIAIDVCHAVDFSTRLVSDPETISRDPVISETGLAAWMYYSTNNIADQHSHIAVFDGRERLDLTDGAVDSLYGATKPVVDGNRIVFVAAAKSFDSDAFNWVLREVPNRDEGEIKELPALFSATEENGEQLLSLVNPEALATNSVVAIAGDDADRARRHPSGKAEVWSWSKGDIELERITHDGRNDFAPSLGAGIIAWQKAKGWPFGWEIMAKVNDTMMQLTTNYYYDMAPKVQGGQIVWYGWDGFDYEIFLFDPTGNETIQITSNRYDDVAPVIWEGAVVWEGYSGLEADIFLWKSGETKKISSNIDDDLYPRIWGNKVVWQGFDGDDYEIYLYDLDKGGIPTKITSNNYDDTNPEIRDDLIVWMGYQDNWDSEIFYADLEGLNSLSDVKVVQLTDREEDDRDPKTAGRHIVWVSEENGNTRIMLAEPR